ncbi:PRC-barrel domain-containing protein [Streptomyces gardneri]|uniref:PRC-barrel domain-containing protein n=1 Tax=Nocardia TaxID=1817 RepID=UPI001357D833|nr:MULTISPECIES: PRC-barrel domain-containing protein [Nocardia]MBF6165810.1 PRC-barrel domain-containing protein [Streptomyces gardneri]MBF6203133.1 PRC-barrel domain-containing protein [Streptomyces gardneri]UAK29991.1 PRC-barrel domain-containing protein [Nocardia asteroides]
MTEMLETLIGSSVYGPEGEKIGKVKRVYVDNSSGSPTWIAVSTGLFSADALVPLAGAEHRPESATLQVRVGKDAVKSSPQLDHNGQISPQAEQELFDHYQIDPEHAAWDVYGRQPVPQPRQARPAMTRPPEERTREQGDAATARRQSYLGSEEETLRMPPAGDRSGVGREPVVDSYAVDTADLGMRDPDGMPQEDPLTEELSDPERRRG